MLGIDSPIQRELHAAIEAGNHAHVRKLVADGAAVNDLHFEQGWPLSHAVDLGHEKIARVLLEAGADPNREDLMKLCIKRNFKDIAKLLTRHGVNLDGFPTWEKDEQRFETSLIRAVRADRPEIVKALLEAGADPNRHNANDESALLLARTRNDKRVVKMIEPYASETEQAWVEMRLSAEYAERLRLENEILDAIDAGDAEKVEHLFRSSARDINLPLNPERGDYPLAYAYRRFSDVASKRRGRGVPSEREVRYWSVIERLASMGARADLGVFHPPMWSVCLGVRGCAGDDALDL